MVKIRRLLGGGNRNHSNVPFEESESRVSDVPSLMQADGEVAGACLKH